MRGVFRSAKRSSLCGNFAVDVMEYLVSSLSNLFVSVSMCASVGACVHIYNICVCLCEC